MLSLPSDIKSSNQNGGFNIQNSDIYMKLCFIMFINCERSSTKSRHRFGIQSGEKSNIQLKVCFKLEKFIYD